MSGISAQIGIVESYNNALREIKETVNKMDLKWKRSENTVDEISVQSNTESPVHWLTWQAENK